MDDSGIICNPKNVDRWKLEQEKTNGNEIVKYLRTVNIKETYNVIMQQLTL